MANTYIVWLDFMIYMPFVASAFIKLKDGGSIKSLAISLSLCVYACFSIACFSFLTLYPMGVLYALVCLEKQRRKEFTAKFSLAFVIAVALSLPIILPSAAAYANAGRNTGLFSEIFNSDVRSADHLYTKFTYVICDAPFIFASAVYFFRKRNEKLTLFLFSALVFCLLPCLIDESMMLLNMGSYYSYSLRFGFISGFLFFFTAALEARDLFAEAEMTPSKKASIISFVSLTALSLIVISGEIFLFVFLYRGINGFEKENAFYEFFPRFAHSVGGLEVSAMIFGGIAIALTVATIFYKLGLARRARLAILLVPLMLSQSVFYGAAVLKGDSDGNGASAAKYDYYASMLSDIDEIDGSLYRLKSYNYYISADAPETLGYYSTSVFNSLADKKNISLAYSLKYGGNGTNSSTAGAFSEMRFSGINI